MRLFLTFIGFFLMFSITASGQSQYYRNRELALIAFNLNIHSNIKPAFDSFGHLFPDVDNRRADKIIALLKERFWYLIEARLEGETGMYILPINSHGQSFKYDHYNFPDVSINRALRVGTSRFYIKVDLNISSAISRKDTGYGARPSQDSSTLKIEDLENAVLPMLTLDITTFNDKGILPQHKLSGSATAEKPWIMSEEIFSGLTNRNEFNKEETDTLLGLINVAITNLIKNF